MAKLSATWETAKWGSFHGVTVRTLNAAERRLEPQNIESVNDHYNAQVFLITISNYHVILPPTVKTNVLVI